MTKLRQFEKTHCGYIAIIGRPNVGKSTLLNRILGQKISITSHKPQTTRHQILGIKTDGERQAIFVDTPGLHKAGKHELNRYMNRVALQALNDVDIVVWMVEGLKWTEEDDWIYKRLKSLNKPVVLIVNKVDRVEPKTTLLPHLQELAQKMDFAAIIPVSAQNGFNVIELEATLATLLPENPHFFPDDQVTDRTDRFLASEIIREKLMRNLHQEIPYALTVEIEEFKEEGKLLRIHAVIWLEKENQKAIVIGEGGQALKRVGKAARLDMEKLFEKKVFLQLWAKVKENWSDDVKALQSLGYQE